jgi:hypothetical protein
MAFELQLPASEIPALAAQYVREDARRVVSDASMEALVPSVRSRGALTMEELHLVGRWKSARSAPRMLRNDSVYVEAVTGTALATDSEQFRIEVLTLLDGIQWPTASVVLHWFHKEPYPILDFRALTSVGMPVPAAYNFAFWTEYVDFCRQTAATAEVTMRDLDRALWQHSRNLDEARRGSR